MIETIIVIMGGVSIAVFAVFMFNVFKGAPLRSYMRKKRIRKFNSQLVDALTTMSNCLKAGLSLPQAIETVERQREPPVSEEFGLVNREHRMGVSLEEALLHLADRMKGEDTDLLVTSITIAYQLGGNLAEIFEQITATIRERNRIQGRIETLTSQGKMQGAIVSALPVALGLVLYLLTPDAMSLLFTTQIGHLLLGIFLVLEVSGWILIRRIVTINV